MIRVQHLVLVGLVSALGCGSAAAQETVLRRAAFELRCPEEQLQIVELDERTQGVRGCGYQVTYVEVCNGPRSSVDTECSWVMQSSPGPPGPQWGPPVMPPVQPSVRPPIQTAPRRR